MYCLRVDHLCPPVEHTLQEGEDMLFSFPAVPLALWWGFSQYLLKKYVDG